jgi:hypothetical protein
MTDTNWYLTLRKQDIISTDEDGRDRVIEHKISRGFTEKEFDGLRHSPSILMTIYLNDMLEQIQKARGNK